MSDSLWSHGLHHARPSCPLPTTWVYSNSCSLCWWCHATISSSVVLFSSCIQSFPASGCFQMNQFFASGGPSIGVFSFNISLSNEHSGLISFRMGWLDLLAVHMGWSFNHENHILAQPLFYLPTLMFSTRTCECIKLTNRRRKRKRRNITLNQISYQIIYFSMLFSKNMLSPVLSNSYSHCKHPESFLNLSHVDLDL